MKIYIVRHGRTNWNNERKAQGISDIPLNETGIEQAYETKKNIENLDIDLIICSPLLRAKQTAEIINEKNIPIIYDDRIKERNYGKVEGKSVYDVDFNGFWDYYKNIKYEDIETVQEVFDRIYKFLEDIIKNYKDKNILLVTHAGIGMAVDCFFTKNIPEGSLIEAGLQLKNCEVKEYEI